MANEKDTGIYGEFAVMSRDEKTQTAECVDRDSRIIRMTQDALESARGLPVPILNSQEDKQ